MPPSLTPQTRTGASLREMAIGAVVIFGLGTGAGSVLHRLEGVEATQSVQGRVLESTVQELARISVVVAGIEKRMEK